MTRRQRDALDFIRSYMLRNGISPSYDEIAAGLGLGPTGRSTVHAALCRLREDGYLTWTPHRRRSIRLTQASTRTATQERPLAIAARALLDELRYENPAADEAVVSASRLGDLDVALAELEAAS